MGRLPGHRSGTVGSSEMNITELLEGHLDLFNNAVESGDFEEMVSHFSDEAVMCFEGIRVGPFVGRDQIRKAYAEQPPDDRLLILEVLTVSDDMVEVAYAWSVEPKRRAGTMVLERQGDLIGRLVVRFD
jgi:hypothetical protein